MRKAETSQNGILRLMGKGKRDEGKGKGKTSALKREVKNGVYILRGKGLCEQAEDLSLRNVPSTLRDETESQGLRRGGEEQQRRPRDKVSSQSTTPKWILNSVTRRSLITLRQSGPAIGTQTSASF